MTPSELRAAAEQWSMAFLGAKVRLMDETETKLLFACTMNEAKPDFPPEALKETFGYKVLSSRAKAIGLSISEACMAFIVATNNSPGKLVMYANGLRFWQHTNNEEVLDIDAFVNIFPMGFPMDSELERLWDLQKVPGLPGGNLLDQIQGDIYV